MIVIRLIVLIGIFLMSESQRVFMPNLALGEYRTIYDKVYHCEPSKNHSIMYNVYFSKKTPSITELKGNFTSSIPFDDTLTIDLNFASWSLTGGWKPNSMVYITKNACTQWKNILGNVWFSFKRGFNFPTASCPIPKGTYISSGINLKEFEDHNFPKVYFYGKYKAVFKIKNNENKLLGCVVVEFQLVRPWEKPI